MTIRQVVTHNLLNLVGWQTKRHLIVFESDDWGAIRMPSKEVYEKLLSEGYRVDKSIYERTDSLAREDDLTALFDVLSRVYDKNGNHPVFTANCVVANPDFERIKSSGFKHYYYEPIIETFKRYHGCEKSFELWKQGISEGVFHPQSHGREHLNVLRWMDALQNKDSDTRHVFEYGLMGLFPKGDDVQGNVFQVALDNSCYDGHSIVDILCEGLALFKRLFGYPSKTFIAPCYTWSPDVEKVLYDNGIVGIQGVIYQRVPGSRHIKHYMGSKNSWGQVYTIRNCFFEPSQGSDIDDCLYRVNCAFRWRKPAIISSHRMNYIGAINENNRNENIVKLYRLLSEIMKTWPDAEFLTSDQLVEFIINRQ